MAGNGTVEFWGVKCGCCGNVIALREAREASKKPQLKANGSELSVFCPKCGQVGCKATEVVRLRGPLPDDFWPRADLFAAA